MCDPGNADAAVNINADAHAGIDFASAVASSSGAAAARRFALMAWRGRGGIGRSQAMSDVQIMPEMAESRDGPREGAITSRHGDARWRGYESRVKEFTPPLSVFFLPSATVGCISYY